MDENLSAKMSLSLLFMRKLSLVNETLRPETETRPRRRDRDYIPVTVIVSLWR